jgi:hypothetical protein
MTVLPHRGDMHTASCEDVTPRSSLLRTHSPIPDGSSILRPWPRARSLCRLLPVPAANGIFPTLSLQIFPRMPGPLARRYREVLLPVSSSASSAFPNRGVGRLPATTREIRLLAEAFFVAADISLCSSLRVCSPPRSFLPLRILPQGSRDFYIRAHRASLPPHVPDMLAVRIQAIDGARTFTLQDSQPCRPLPSVLRFKRHLTMTPARLEVRMDSLLPFLQGTCTPYNMPVYPGARRIVANSDITPENRCR